MTIERDARNEIVRVGKSLFDRGYVHATAGNISVRLPNDAGFLITPTDACLGFLDAEKLSLVGIDGTQRSGDCASKTLSLHRAIYDSDRAAACVIHAHSTHCVSLSLRDENVDSEELLPPITPYFVMKVGHVPRVRYARYVRPGAPEQAWAAREAIVRYAQRGTPIRAMMFDRLGPNVWHETPAQAMAVLEELEETAKLVCQSLLPISPLNAQQIDELRTTLGAQW
jgi:3-dehydro-4-phosphotetronate decarboxylase